MNYSHIELVKFALSKAETTVWPIQYLTFSNVKESINHSINTLPIHMNVTKKCIKRNISFKT